MLELLEWLKTRTCDEQQVFVELGLKTMLLLDDEWRLMKHKPMTKMRQQGQGWALVLEVAVADT